MRIGRTELNNSTTVASQVVFQGAAGNTLELRKFGQLNQFADLAVDDLTADDVVGSDLFITNTVALGANTIACPIVWEFGSGTNKTTLSPSNATGDRQLLLPDKSGTLLTTADAIAASTGAADADKIIRTGANGRIASSLAPSGSIIQTATTIDATNRSTSSTTYVSSGISVALSSNLQSTNSKVRIRFSALFSSNSGMSGVAGLFRLHRGTTDLTPTGIDSLSGVRVASNADTVVSSFEFVDTPSSVAAGTYTIHWRVSSATGFLGRRGLDNLFNVPSYLTAEEII